MKEFFKNMFALTALFLLAIVDSITSITEFVSDEDEVKELEQNNED